MGQEHGLYHSVAGYPSTVYAEWASLFESEGAHSDQPYLLVEGRPGCTVVTVENTEYVITAYSTAKAHAGEDWACLRGLPGATR